MNKAVIFDMDGVLIDSQPMHYEVDRVVLTEFGLEVDIPFLEKYAGTTTLNRFIHLKNTYGLSGEPEMMAERRERVMFEYLENEDFHAIKGIPELLEDIKNKNLYTAVASSSSYEFIHIVLKKLKIEKYFDIITSGVDVRHGKPNPDVFILAADRLGAFCDECIVIEDSGNGVKAALSANMKVIGYRNHNSGDQDLSGATYITEDFTKINADLIMSL